MRKSKLVLIAVVVILGAGIGLFAIFYQPSEKPAIESPAHAEHGEGEEEHGESGEQAEISDAAIKNAGIVIESAGPQAIEQTIALTGRVTLNQNKTAIVKARFPGVIRSVSKAQGDRVAKDEILVTVESNESLQVYSIKSPIAGTVLARNGSIGDTAAGEPLFTVADISELWVELHVFAQDAGRIIPGQLLTVSSSECDDVQETTVSSVLPITESSSQTLLARATVKNLDSHWLPGMSVRGDVVISEKEAGIAVRTSAVQRMEGKQVVFVKDGDEYIARNVEIGLADEEWTEIKAGVKLGESYVSDGSFTVKAEIGKSEAGHEH